MKRSVWLLFCCQALMNAVTIGQVAMSALIGHSLAGDKALSTLPFALQMCATMAASIPAGIVFSRLGRRPGFWLGCLSSFVGSLVFALGVWKGSFLVYCLGALPAGAGFGIAQHFRFAAAEAADVAQRPRAIALVMAGGLVAALLGPELVKHTKDLTGPLLFLGTYLCVAVLPVVCAVLLLFADLPPTARPVGAASPTPIRAFLGRPDFLVAVFAGMVGYGAMNLVMASTPLEMMLCGYGVNDAADVIRLHAMAMYAPGFVTGRLIQRFGPQPLIAVGGALSMSCAALSFAAPGLLNFMAALVLLGLGWNLMFTSATALLSRAYDPAERIRAQATNDFIVFGTVACTALGSGVLHATAGWTALNLSIVPPILAATALVLWHRARRGERADARLSVAGGTPAG